MREAFTADYEKLFFQTGAKECINCGDINNLHLHHIIPIAYGGTNRPSNLTVLCNVCHSKAHGNSKLVKNIRKSNDLLTYENIYKWRVSEKLTYDEIADITGAHFTTVAKASRKFGLIDIVNKDKRKIYAIDKIVDYFAQMQEGEKVKRSDIYKELEISYKTFGRQEKTLKFEAALGKYNIKKEKTQYKKEALV